MPPSPPEVVVLGAGPAGAAAARLLASWGHSVRLIDRPSTATLALAKSLPPSTGKLFDVLGVRAAIDRAAFVRATGNTVWWGSESCRVESFAGGQRGWQVTADRFDQVLREAALRAGVAIDTRRATAADGTDGAFTLDCTGRRGVVARARRLRRFEDGPRTVALIARWQPRTSFAVPDATHTLVESYADGWAWSVPDADGCRHVAVMVDPRRSSLRRGAEAERIYLAEIGKTTKFRKLLADATLVAGPAGWDASMYSAARYVDGTALLVGDAASFIDPLSSAGVKKALASGWLAAVAVHTAIMRPAMQATALAFFNAREAEVYAAFQAMTARHLAAAAAGHQNPFWSDRADVDEGRQPDDGPDVRAAFERIRASATLDVRPGEHARIEPRPAVSGCEIVLEERLVSDADPAGMRYAYDVDLISLMTLAPGHAQVPDLFAAYQRRSGPVELPDFLAALATLVARGWLAWSKS